MMALQNVKNLYCTFERICSQPLKIEHFQHIFMWYLFVEKTMVRRIVVIIKCLNMQKNQQFYFYYNKLVEDILLDKEYK